MHRRPRYKPISSQEVALTETAAASTVFDHPATVIVYATGDFRYAINVEADDTNSLPCNAYSHHEVSVGAGEYISVIYLDVSGGGGPAPVGLACYVTEVSVA